MAKPKGSETAISLDNLVELGSKISEIDAKISAASGNEAQAKKALLEKVISDNQERVDEVVANFVKAIENLDPEVIVGTVGKLESTLKETFAPRVDAFVTEELGKVQSVGKDEVEALRTTRKELVGNFGALKTVLESFSIDTSEVEVPKSRGGRPAGSGGGSGSKSGKNREGYRFTMDGKDRPDSQNTLSSLAFYATVGCPKAGDSARDEKDKWSTKELKDFIAAQGVKYGEDETFEVSLPNGKKIGARKEAISEEAVAEETPAEAVA